MVGTSALAGTLAAPIDSGLFYGLGLFSAAVWIFGALLSGPIPLRRHRDTAGDRRDIALAILVGVALFGAFAAASVVASSLPSLSDSVGSVLDRADAGSWVLVLSIALVNGVGEEMFFRGALHAAVGPRHRALWATAIYALVTVATLNLALVAAALVMGAVFSAERRITEGIFAPTLTHLTWSTLMLLFLPR